MEIAILGLPQSGKSTLFKIMTGVDSAGMYGETVVRGVAKVPDERFLKLAEIFRPEKVTPATVPFMDIQAAGEKAWNTIRQNISGADGIVHILDAFTSDDVTELVTKYNKLTDELILADLVIVENKLERLNKLPETALKQDEKIQKTLFPQFKEKLESGCTLRNFDLSDQEQNIAKNFAFLSMKPELIVLNTKEGAPNIDSVFSSEAKTDSPVISICCKTEAEIAELPTEDRREFLDSLGIKTPAFERVIKTAFSLLGRIYYFTVGTDEVRAWVIQRGSTAPRAAAAIHKDFERGFIKAEVVSYEDFISSGKDLVEAKNKGKMRLEGKGYTVQDGDIISFRFNV